MNHNSVQLVGRLGQDPEVSATNSGDLVCNFSIAISRWFKREDESDFEQETTWVPITAWRRIAEKISTYAKKGTEVLVVGELREKKWEDKDTQKPRSRMYVLANRVDFGDGRITKEQGDAPEAPQPETSQKEAPDKPRDEEKDDLPF